MVFTKKGKGLIASAIVGIAMIAGYHIADNKGMIPKGVSANAILAKKVDLPKAAPLSTVANVPLLPLPSNEKLGTGTEIRIDEMAWNSQLGLNYANGGAVTTKGSLMEKHGLTNVRIIRQDNCDQQVNDLAAFGAEFKKVGGNPQKGVQAISLMLDGSPSYMLAAKNALAPYNLHPVIVASFGKSHHEDALIGDEKFKKDPKKLKGAFVVGVLYDGDMNIAIKFAQDNDVRINPNTKTYDPDALNIIAAEDYLKAVDMLRDGVTETRTNVRTGKPIEVTTDKKKAKLVGGPTYAEGLIVTWTPGDVRVAKEVGGLVPILTTADNYWQMPEAFIVIKEWAQANPQLVKNLIKAGLEGGAQVKVHDKALYKACEISAKIWEQKGQPKEERDPKYWYENFRLHKITDKAGKEVEVGGSMNFSIEDNIVAFGLDNGDGGPAKSSYTVFGDEMARLWPDKLKEYPAFDEAFDPTYLKMVAKETTLNKDLSQKPEYDGKAVSQTVSSSTEHIEFKSGSAALTPEGVRQVKKLADKVNISSLVITVKGYADRHGSHEANMALSKARAEAVVAYCVNKGMDQNKFRVEFYGDTEATGNDAADRKVVIEYNK